MVRWLFGLSLALACSSTRSTRVVEKDAAESDAAAGAAGVAGTAGASGSTPDASAGAGGDSAAGASATAGADAGDDADTGAAGTAGCPGGPGSNGFGDGCESDCDCAFPFVCWRADDALGGPAGGLCTEPCNTSSDCTLGIGACATFGTRSFCVSTCQPGAPTATKCNGRLDVGCGNVDGSGDVCVPTCNDDSACPTGSFCDRGTNLCSSTPSTGEPVGTRCDSLPVTCRGECRGTAGECEERCVFGAPVSCAPGATCHFSFSGSSTSGDLGACALNCSAAADCDATPFTCNGTVCAP